MVRTTEYNSDVWAKESKKTGRVWEEKKKRLRERLLKKEKNNFRKFPLYLLPDQIKLRRGSPSLRLLFNHSCETELIPKKTTDRRMVGSSVTNCCNQPSQNNCCIYSWFFWSEIWDGLSWMVLMFHLPSFMWRQWGGRLAAGCLVPEVSTGMETQLFSTSSGHLTSQHGRLKVLRETTSPSVQMLSKSLLHCVC